jgi:hypothetical protein
VTIVAKFDSKCRSCGGPIAKGERVNWTKGVAGVEHITCPPRQLVMAAAVSTPVAVAGPRMATENQRGWAKVYLTDRDLLADPEFFDAVNAMDAQEYEDWLFRAKERVDTLSFSEASQLIDRLKKLPFKPKQRQTQPPILPLVPDGRYAVQLAGQWKLFRIWRGTKNPNVQHVYAVQGVEKGERVFGADERDAVLEIAKDPGEAAVMFGHRTGRCSRCGESLKVNLSRKMGVGPVCAKHWFDNEARLSRMADAREKLREAGIDPQDANDDLSGVRR